MTGVTDGDSDLAFTYDALNRVEAAATNGGGLQPLVTLTNSFDAVGNRTALNDDAGPLGGTTAYAYDLAGRLTKLTTPAGAVINLTYDAADRPAGITFPNGVSTGASYDTSGRLANLAHTRGGIDLASFTYGYNALGSIAQIAELGQTRNFSYDALLRLTSGGTAASPESYAYDAEGNRTASHLSAAHTHDDANRLTEDDSFCYGYDANGNLTDKTAKVSGTCSGGVTAYIWDAQDRLTRIDFPDLSVATYAYDGVGRRIEKAANGTVTRYVYDGEDIVLEYDGANVLTARFTHGQRTDQPLAMERGATLAYFQADHLGSVRQITDTAGTVINTYDYDSYGNFEIQSETLAQPYAFTGREYDAESGLFYYRTRYYDPATGRFISEDPIGFSAGDTNLYGYVYNDPVNLIDPTGLQAGERAGTLQPAVKTAPVLGLLGQALRLIFSSIARDLVVGVLTNSPSDPDDPNRPDNRNDQDGDGDNGDGDSNGRGGGSSGGGGGPKNAGSPPGSGGSKPDLGKPGSRRNPDGTRKNPMEQLDQLKDAKDKGKLIDDLGKSERAVRNLLDRTRGDLRDIDFDDFD